MDDVDFSGRMRVFAGARFRLSGVKSCTIAEVCVLILDVPVVVVVVVVQERIGARDLSGCVKSIPKRYGTVSDKPSGAECFLQSLVGDDFLGWTFSHFFLRNQYSRHVHNPPAHGHCTIGIWYDHSSISVCVCVCVFLPAGVDMATSSAAQDLPSGSGERGGDGRIHCVFSFQTTRGVLHRGAIRR